MRGQGRTWRLVAGCAAALLAASAGGEGGVGSGGPSGPSRIVGVTGVRAAGEGFVTVGGRRLRYLAPGAKRWKTLQENPGDNLYRVGVDEAGQRVLAAWEKDPSLHLFELRTGKHLQLTRPPKPNPSHALSLLESVTFSSDGGWALVLMAERQGRFQDVTALWRVALDGSGKLEQLVRTDGELLLDSGPWGLVTARPLEQARRKLCAINPCLVDIVAYEVTAAGAQERVILSSQQWQARLPRGLRTQDPELVAIEVEQAHTDARAVLLYKPSLGAVALAKVPSLPKHTNPPRHRMVTRFGELLTLKPVDTGLQLERTSLDGATAGTWVRLPPRANFESPIYGYGVRKDNTLWLHWGDHLVFVDAGGGLRSVDLRPLAGRFDEWAGVAAFREDTETLWVAVEVGAGRDLFRVRLPELEKRAKPWPSTPAGCSQLPPVSELMRWKVQSIESCSGGRPHPRQSRPTPLDVVRTLPDGSLIVNGGPRGCYRARREPCTSKCLPPDTLIATPAGDLRVDALKEGMPVWTRNRRGERVAGTVGRLHVEPVAPTHQVVHLRLSDGREVRATPGHPVATGRGIETLKAGDRYDGAQVVETKRVALTTGETRDLLPSGDTGVYWADGVPLGSTLFRALPAPRASR